MIAYGTQNVQTHRATYFLRLCTPNSTDNAEAGSLESMADSGDQEPNDLSGTRISTTVAPMVKHDSFGARRTF